MAHVRHVHTGYGRLLSQLWDRLSQLWDRQLARDQVRERVEDVLRNWKDYPHGPQDSVRVRSRGNNVNETGRRWTAERVRTASCATRATSTRPGQPTL